MRIKTKNILWLILFNYIYLIENCAIVVFRWSRNYYHLTQKFFFFHFLKCGKIIANVTEWMKKKNIYLILFVGKEVQWIMSHRCSFTLQWRITSFDTQDKTCLIAFKFQLNNEGWIQILRISYFIVFNCNSLAADL